MTINYLPKIPAASQEQPFSLDRLSKEKALRIFENLPIQDLFSVRTAYPRFKPLIKEMIDRKFIEVVRSHLGGNYSVPPNVTEILGSVPKPAAIK